MDVESEFTQHYDPNLEDAVQVWVFCRMCRCRIQVRCVPRAELPFRCFCGHQATFFEIDVFQDEEEARRFARTFEDIYQTTKKLMKDADMPAPPKTRMYDPADYEKALLESDEEDLDSFRKKLGELAQAIGAARDRFQRHEALVALADYTFERKQRFPEAKAHCVQACRMDIEQAPWVVREASALMQRGQRVKLQFPTFRQLADLFEEEGAFDKALAVATRAKALGLPGHEERIAKLRMRLR